MSGRSGSSKPRQDQLRRFTVTGHALIQEGSFMPEHNPAIHLERFNESHLEGVTVRDGQWVDTLSMARLRKR